MPRTNKTIAERFAEKVQIAPNGCHEWIGALGGSFGYGIINVNGRHTRAHRYAWEQAYGPLRPGDCVLHHCDNPRCVRVDHLFLGDRLINNRDAIAKGRRVEARAKLTSEQVRQAFHMRDQGATYAEIAEVFGLSGGGTWQLLNESQYARTVVPAGVQNRARSTITAEEIARARAMRSEGMTWQAAADTLGVDMTTLFNNIPERDGHKHKITAEHLATIRAAVAEGETIKAVSARLGLKYTSVTFALKSRKGSGVPSQSGPGGWRPGSGRKPSAP
jgi:predicted DNA-binding protein (UPF0251 family)